MATNYTAVGQVAQKKADRHKGIASQAPRAGFVRIGTPTNASEITSQQNVDWMNYAR